VRIQLQFESLEVDQERIELAVGLQLPPSVNNSSRRGHIFGFNILLMPTQGLACGEFATSLIADCDLQNPVSTCPEYRGEAAMLRPKKDT
jgi:hypothetical protein